MVPFAHLHVHSCLLYTSLFHFSYQRYLENQIREVFGLTGTPVRMVIRERGDKD